MNPLDELPCSAAKGPPSAALQLQSCPATSSKTATNHIARFTATSTAWHLHCNAAAPPVSAANSRRWQRVPPCSWPRSRRCSWLTARMPSSTRRKPLQLVSIFHVHVHPVQTPGVIKLGCFKTPCTACSMHRVHRMAFEQLACKRSCQNVRLPASAAGM